MLLCDFCRFFDPPVSFGVTVKITAPSAASTSFWVPCGKRLKRLRLSELATRNPKRRLAPPFSLEIFPISAAHYLAAKTCLRNSATDCRYRQNSATAVRAV